MLKNFIKNNPIHKKIAKNFDFLFLFSLPSFFVKMMVFCLGMTLSYYHLGNNENYFLLNFSALDFLYFLFLFIFISLCNFYEQIDDISKLKWKDENANYKLNLNYLYVCPNFISIKKVIFLNDFRFFMISLIPIFYLSFESALFLILYFLILKKINETKIYSTINQFLKKCILTYCSLFLLFASGSIYFDNYDMIFYLSNFLLLILCFMPIIFAHEIKYSNFFYENNFNIINDNKRKISLASILMLFIIFIISFSNNNPALSHFSLISIPFFIYSFLRGEDKDFIRSYTYPILVANVLISWTLYPLLLIFQILMYYLSKYYYWHRFNVHYPKFVIDEN